MEVVCLPQNTAAACVAALRNFRWRHRGQRGIYLIEDSGPSHDAARTWDYLVEQPHWWYPHLTPVNAAWPNQAEPLIEAFASRDLQRASWQS
jgi:hypothetical protein